MRVRILGESVITLQHRTYTPQAPHLFALLLRLSADVGHFFTRDELAGLLFPTAPSVSASMHSIRQLLYQAGRMGAVLDKRGEAVTLRPGSVTTDIDDVIPHASSQQGVGLRALSILPGYAPTMSQDYLQWLDTYRTHQYRRLRHALLAAIEHSRTRADWAAVEARAVECLLGDPLNEMATLALAEALARTGSKHRALQVLDSYNSEVGTHAYALSLPITLLRQRISGTRTPSRLQEYRTPLFDRGDALASLHARHADAVSRHFCCTLLRGEAGIGKTRLLEEFRASLMLQDASNIALVTQPTSERFCPYAFFAVLLPQLLRLPGAAGRDPRLASFLSHISTDAIHSRVIRFDAEQSALISAGLQHALMDLLDAISSERTLTIIVDDSETIDDISMYFLKTLTLQAPTLAVYLLIARHPGDTRASLNQLTHHQMLVRPLTSHSSGLLLDALLSSVLTPATTAERNTFIGIAGGNPQFLQLLADQRSEHASAPDLPSGIVAAIDRSIANLPSDMLRLLEACVVLNEHCTVKLLESVIGTTPFPLLCALELLEQAGFIDCQGEHILLRSTSFRDRVLASASKGVIALLHARSADALEAHGTHLNAPSAVASHWHNAGRPDRAAALYSETWRRSIQLGHPKLAEEGIRRQLAACDHSALSIPLYEHLIEATRATGNTHATVRAIDERTAVVARCGITDERREDYAFDRLAAELEDHAYPSTAELTLKRFMRSPSLSGGRRLQAARLLLASADASADKALAQEVYDTISSYPIVSGEEGARDMATLIYHTVFGDRDEARTLALRTLSQTTHEPQRWLHVTAQLNASLALRVADRSDIAIAHLSDCYDNVRAIGANSWCVRTAARMANFVLDDGDVSLAREWANRASLHAAAGDSGRMPVDYLSASADLAILAGDFGEASHWIETMRDHSPLYSALRFKMELLTYSLRLAQYRGAPPDGGAIEVLLSWHLRARSFARHDDAMDALWVGLTQQGRGDFASSLLTDYLEHYRRENRRPSYLLRVRSARDPMWATYRMRPPL